jgi:hypothetical protein
MSLFPFFSRRNSGEKDDQTFIMEKGRELLGELAVSILAFPVSLVLGL